MCGFNDNATSEKKVISSSNWPQNYNNWDDCEWFITTDANSKIEIVFEQLAVELEYDILVHCRKSITEKNNKQRNILFIHNYFK